MLYTECLSFYFSLSLILGDTNFLNNILSFTRGQRCSDLTRFGVLFDIIFSHHWATMQQPWRSSCSLETLGAVVTYSVSPKMLSP